MIGEFGPRIRVCGATVRTRVRSAAFVGAWVVLTAAFTLAGGTVAVYAGSVLGTPQNLLALSALLVGGLGAGALSPTLARVATVAAFDRLDSASGETLPTDAVWPDSITGLQADRSDGQRRCACCG